MAWALASLRFPSPFIEPDVPIYGIRLSDWLHLKAARSNADEMQYGWSAPSGRTVASRLNRAVRRTAVYVCFGLFDVIHGSEADFGFGSPAEVTDCTGSVL